MAVYNSEKYLAEAIESILNQTFKDFELIIINDNSTDNSLKIIKEYAKKDKRIIIISIKKNRGSAYARNKGLRIAKGKYIAIMDSDDVSLHQRLEIQYKHLEENPEIFLLGSSWNYIDEKGNIMWSKINNFSPRYISKNLPHCSVIHQPTVMFRNEKGIGYREKLKYAQDRDLWLRFLSEKKKMKVIPLILINYRINSNSVSITNSQKQILFVNQSILWFFERQKYGKDSYNSFDPKNILNLDFSKIDKKEFLRTRIWTSFFVGDYLTSIKFSKKYIGIHGALNKAGVYYILSILGNKFKIFHKFNRFLLSKFGEKPYLQQRRKRDF